MKQEVLDHNHGEYDGQNRTLPPTLEYPGLIHALNQLNERENFSMDSLFLILCQARPWLEFLLP